MTVRTIRPLCAAALLVLVGLLLSDAFAQAGPWSRRANLSVVPPVPASLVGTVRHVVDGDTIDITTSTGQAFRVRLEGIDCPERGQPFSRLATGLTRALVFGNTVQVSVKGVDRYGRLLARVTVAGKDVSVALTEAGLAWHYVEFSSDPVLAAAERAAHENKRAIWSDPRPVTPMGGSPTLHEEIRWACSRRVASLPCGLISERWPTADRVAAGSVCVSRANGRRTEAL